MFSDRININNTEALQKGNEIFDRAFDLAKKGQSTEMLMALDFCAHVDKKYAADIIRKSAKTHSKKGS